MSETATQIVVARSGQLPVGPVGRKGIGVWGVGTLVASEAALFSYLLFSYYYLGAIAPSGWLLETHPDLKLALPNTIILLASSGVAWMGEHGVLKQRRGQAMLGFGLAFILGAIFVAVQFLEWKAKTFQFGTSSYASIYFVTTAFHIAHVIIGLLALLALFAWTSMDYFSRRRRIAVSAGVLYWHFVDLIWLFIFTTYYITPYLGFGR